MADRDAFDAYLAKVEARLPLGANPRHRVIAELRAHLEEARDAERRRGLAPDEAAAVALARMGTPDEIARRYRAEHPLLDGAVVIGGLACAAVAGWLLIVAATVLPRQDPEHVAFWNLVAVGFAVYAAMTLAYLRLRDRLRAAVPAVAGVSAVAVVAGGWLAIPMLLTSGDFEGYIVLMGVVLAGQGVVVLADAFASRRGAEPAS
jgi:HAAS